MNVFVTGGSGLVGRHVIAALRRRGDRVRALARRASAAAELAALGAEPLAGDLSDAVRLDALIAGSDAVVHAAAVVLGGGPWRVWHETNVAGTERIARSAARHGARLVHISSVAVYGRRPARDLDGIALDETFDLDHATPARDAYARSKREAEQAVWRTAAETQLSAIALRPCVLYGEGDRHLSPRLARLLRLGLVPRAGRGDNRLTVVYAGSVADAVTAALDRRGVTGPFNVANDGNLSLRAFVERFAAGLGERPRWLPLPAGLARAAARAWDAALDVLPRPAASLSLGNAVQFLTADNPYSSARAERELAWRPSVDAAEAAERTGASFRRTAPPTHP